MNSPSEGFRLLIVDDDQDILDLLQMELIKQNVKTFCANSLKTAQEIFIVHKPQFVLSDYLLGDGTGLDFLRWIRSNFNFGTLFYLMSGNTWFDKLELYLFEGSLIFPKPIKWKELKQEITRFEEPLKMRYSKYSKPAEDFSRLKCNFNRIDQRKDTLTSKEVKIVNDAKVAQVIKIGIHWFAIKVLGSQIATKQKVQFEILDTESGGYILGEGSLLLTHRLPTDSNYYLQFIGLDSINDFALLNELIEISKNSANLASLVPEIPNI